MVVSVDGWRGDLNAWLEPFVAGLGDRRRRRMCPLYVAGLIGPGDRKSIQPVAAREEAAGYDQLHHFVASGLWRTLGGGAAAGGRSSGRGRRRLLDHGRHGPS